MVVGDLRRVKDALRLPERLAADGLDERGIGRHAAKLGLVEPVQRRWTLGVDVVRQVLRVYAWIGGVLALIECLNQVERHLGRIAELTVAVYLQRCQVVELGRLFLALFLLNLSDGERLAFNGLESLLALFFLGELAFCCRKRDVAIDGGQHPVGLGLEVVYLLLAVDDEGQRRRLHTTYRQHLPVLAVLQRVEAGAVHAQQPVADGTGQACHVEWLVVLLVF